MEIEPVAVTVALVMGAVMGMGYFAGLWVTVQRLPEAKRPVLVWALSALLRVAGATVVFLLLMSWGTPQLIAGGIGFIAARLLATRIWGPAREPRMPVSEGEDEDA